MLDTAGRTHIDEPLMLEMAAIEAATSPHEILLVADSLTGQDAVNVARSFSERVGVTGIVLTRVDGDGRGGAALSMRAVTGRPIKLIGTGEKMDALEDFHPGRIADRILGMGDIVSLVERAAENIDAEKAHAAAAKMKKGEFDLEDLADQLSQMQKIGGMSGILGMMPGIGKVKKQIAAAGLDDKLVPRQLAIISSMTRKERHKPALMNASRKRRVASGSGTDVQDVNKLLKMHRQMADMMKKIGRQKGGLGALFGMGGGAMPQPDPAMLEQMQKSRPRRSSGRTAGRHGRRDRRPAALPRRHAEASRHGRRLFRPARTGQEEMIPSSKQSGCGCGQLRETTRAVRAVLRRPRAVALSSAARSTPARAWQLAGDRDRPLGAPRLRNVGRRREERRRLRRLLRPVGAGRLAGDSRSAGFSGASITARATPPKPRSRVRAYAYDELRRTTLVSYIDPENEASKRVAQRLGAAYETHDRASRPAGRGVPASRTEIHQLKSINR